MAENNAKSADPSGKAQTGPAVPMHKQLAEGKHPDTGCGSGKKTPA